MLPRKTDKKIDGKKTRYFWANGGSSATQIEQCLTSRETEGKTSDLREKRVLSRGTITTDWIQRAGVGPM